MPGGVRHRADRAQRSRQVHALPRRSGPARPRRRDGHGARPPGRVAQRAARRVAHARAAGPLPRGLGLGARDVRRAAVPRAGLAAPCGEAAGPLRPHRPPRRAAPRAVPGPAAPARARHGARARGGRAAARRAVQRPGPAQRPRAAAAARRAGRRGRLRPGRDARPVRRRAAVRPGGRAGSRSPGGAGHDRRAAPACRDGPRRRPRGGLPDADRGRAVPERGGMAASVRALALRRPAPGGPSAARRRGQAVGAARPGGRGGRRRRPPGARAGRRRRGEAPDTGPTDPRAARRPVRRCPRCCWPPPSPRRCGCRSPRRPGC